MFREFQEYRFEVNDVNRIEPLVYEFYLKLEDKRERKKRSNPKKAYSIQFSEIILTKDDLDDIDEKDVLINPLQSGENEFYLNMDNVFIVRI